MGSRFSRIAPVAVFAALAMAAAATIPASAATSSTATVPVSSTIDESTKTNVLAAMHGEAFARASYLAYAAQASVEGHRSVRSLFTRTARVELNDHFTLEAEFVGLVGDDEANLLDAIAGEDYETTIMYPQFAAEAAADGDQVAADLFTEIAADEAAHRDALQQALAALDGQATMPTPPVADLVDIPAGPAQSSGRTLTNLDTAMHGEAFASAKYLLYAQHAQSTNHPALARLFVALSQIELREHWAAEAVLAGHVGYTTENLTVSAEGENYEATVMYPDFAAQAEAAGDTQVADALTEIAGDEAKHRDAYLRALNRIS